MHKKTRRFGKPSDFFTYAPNMPNSFKHFEEYMKQKPTQRRMTFLRVCYNEIT